MSRYVTEMIGTFFLVLTIGLAVLSGTALVPLAIGALLMAMVYMGGHISGAHYNPAVSLAMMLRGKLPISEFVSYVISQLVGSLAATGMVWIIVGKTFAPETALDVLWFQPLIVEFLYTFALALVVLNVATSPATECNPYYGLAIGFTIVAAAFAGGPVSGGAFNPAVGTGPTIIHALVGEGSWKHLWLYWVGPFAGGATAAGVYRVQHSNSGE